jgi:hypothetical protein
MIDDLPRDEAERLLSLTKFGDPSTGWRRRQQSVSWAKCEVGVTDAKGRRIQGITADLSVRYGRRPHLKQFLFSMYSSQHRGNRRAYSSTSFKVVDDQRILIGVLTNTWVVTVWRVTLNGLRSVSRARCCSSAGRPT